MLKKQPQTCIFCAINAEIEQAYSVFENENFFVILDKRPVFLGHCLVIPRNHFQTLNDLPDRLIKPLFTNVKRIGRAIEKAMESEGTFIAMNNKVSQSVPHLHVHIVPRNYNDGLRGFFWPRQSYVNEQQIIEVQNKIKHFLDQEKG